MQLHSGKSQIPLR